MIKRLLLYSLLLASVILEAQIQHPGFPMGAIESSAKTLRSAAPTVVEMPTIDIDSITAETESSNHKALRFAHPFDVELSPDNCGRWYNNDDGSRVWQVTIRSQDAASINIIFDRFKVPEGGKVFIYNTDMSHIIGAFTSANNKESGILPTLPVIGSEVVVEYQEPRHTDFEAQLLIAQVNHDYTGIFNLMKTGYFGDSEYCEKDVTCYVDAIYQKTRRSTIKLIINGSELMTGTLVNNTKQDGTPYVLTAAHGYESYDYSVDKTLFIFNYEVPLCFTDLEGNREQSIAGGTMRAYSPKVNGEALDFALVEISVKPPTAYLPYYAGWNRSTSSPAYSFCIHHPQGDVKKISFEDNALLKKTLKANGITYLTNGHWNVQRWEVGATEGGSSGSGIFNTQGQVIGSLSAGASNCANPQNDYFFRFDLAWEVAPENDRQLAHWLDTYNTDVQHLGAYEDPAAAKTMRLTHVHDSSDITIVKDKNSGNIAGNNSLGITRFVEKFSNTGEKQILGLYFIAAEGKPGSIVNTIIWTGDDKPDQEIHTEALLIKRWAYTSYTPPAGSIGGFYPKDSLNMQENFVLFSEPITVTGNYFIGFEVDNTEPSPAFGLTLSHTNSEDNAFYYDTEWHSYLDLANYNKATTLWVDPVVQSSEISAITTTKAKHFKVYPNPVRTGEALIISGAMLKENISIYDVLGRKHSVKITQQNDAEVALNIDPLAIGTYILRTQDEQVLFQKY